MAGEIAKLTINIDGNGDKSLSRINQELAKSQGLISSFDQKAQRLSANLGRARLASPKNSLSAASLGKQRMVEPQTAPDFPASLGTDSGQEARRIDKSSRGIQNSLRGISSATRGSRLGGLFRPLTQGARLATLAVGGATAGLSLLGAGAVAAGVHMSQVGKEFQSNSQIVANTLQSTGEGTKALTVDATALSRTFGVEFKDTITTADQLSRSFGLSSKQALGLLEQGFLSGANAGGDMLEQVNKFSAGFRAAGVSAEQSLALIAQGSKNGNTEEMLAQITNFKEKSKNISQSTVDVLTAQYGKDFTSQFVANLKAGKLETVDAMQTISKAIAQSKLSDGTVKAAISDMFGSEANIQILETIGQMDASLTSLSQKNAQINGGLSQQLSIEKQIAAEQAKFASGWASVGTAIDTATNYLKLGFYSAINGATELLGGLYDGFMEIVTLDFDRTERKQLQAYQADQSAKEAQLKTLESEYKAVRSLGQDGAVQQQRLMDAFDSLNKGKLMAGDITYEQADARFADRRKEYLDKVMKESPLVETTLSKIKAKTPELNQTSTRANRAANTAINSIVGGGKEVRNVQVTIQKMVGIEQITTTNMSESINDVRKTVSDMLISAISGAEETYI